MKQKKKSDVAALLDYAGSHRGLTFLGLALSAAAMLLSMAPYICIWLAARDLIEVAPDWTAAQSVTRYGWMPLRRIPRRCWPITWQTSWAPLPCLWPCWP